MSNALLEAMGHGLPCIASKIFGNTDLIQHGKNGLLVEAGDSLDLSKGITRLIDNEKLREYLGKRARVTIEKSYTTDFVGKLYVELYKSNL